MNFTGRLGKLSSEIYPVEIYLIYLLNAIESTPGGSSTVHICTQILHKTTQLTTRTTQTFWKIAGRALPMRVIPWHFHYN